MLAYKNVPTRVFCRYNRRNYNSFRRIERAYQIFIKRGRKTSIHSARLSALPSSARHGTELPRQVREVVVIRARTQHERSQTFHVELYRDLKEEFVGVDVESVSSRERHSATALRSGTP